MDGRTDGRWADRRSSALLSANSSGFVAAEEDVSANSNKGCVLAAAWLPGLPNATISSLVAHVYLFDCSIEMDKNAALEIGYVMAPNHSSWAIKRLQVDIVAQLLAPVSFGSRRGDPGPTSCFSLPRWIQAFTQRGSFEFVDNRTICHPYASHICFLNLETKLQSVFQSPVRGIGALAANGSKRIFAFSEQKLSPSIFLYGFPEFQLKKRLKGTVAEWLSFTVVAEYGNRLTYLQFQNVLSHSGKCKRCVSFLNTMHLLGNTIKG